MSVSQPARASFRPVAAAQVVAALAAVEHVLGHVLRWEREAQTD